MSLLLDALKQAEATRAQVQSGAAPENAEGMTLEALAEPTAPPTPALEKPVNTATAQPAQSARHARPAARAAEFTPNNAARDLFEVKQKAPNRTPLILASCGVALLLSGAGYVWWAIQPHSNLTKTVVHANATGSVLALPPLAPAQSTPLSDVSPLPAATQNAPQRPDLSATANLSTNTVRRQKSGEVTGFRKQMSKEGKTEGAAQPVRNLPPVNVTATNEIQAAYSAFLEGNLSLARQRYQDVLRQDPRSVDAMNALGMIAWRSGQLDLAERMFRNAVQTDPKDITALSQLALLYAEGDPINAESRLRSLIATQPAAGSAYYALGSLLIRQNRWNEAQQALFQAYTLDSDNPDVLFNLAVCLEHLSQAPVAKSFYERALSAAARRPAGFDKSVVQSRIQALGGR